jgi:hypothetical protein
MCATRTAPRISFGDVQAHSFSLQCIKEPIFWNAFHSNDHNEGRLWLPQLEILKRMPFLDPIQAVACLLYASAEMMENEDHLRSQMNLI